MLPFRGSRRRTASDYDEVQLQLCLSFVVFHSMCGERKKSANCEARKGWSDDRGKKRRGRVQERSKAMRGLSSGIVPCLETGFQNLSQTGG